MHYEGPDIGDGSSWQIETTALFKELEAGCPRFCSMDNSRIYDEPSEVNAKDGTVEVAGPDAVEVRLTPEAAGETSERLLQAAMEARGQSVLANHKRRNDDAT